MDVDQAGACRLAASALERGGVNLGLPIGGGDGDAHPHPQGICDRKVSLVVVGVPYRRTVDCAHARVVSAHTSSEMSPLLMAC